MGRRLRYRFAMPSFLEGPRRNGNTFFRGTHERARKDTSFDPRRTLRATKNGNGNTFERPTGNFFLSTKGHEGPRRTPLLIHEGPLRGTKNGNGNTFVRGGHGGPRRTATQLQLLFVHEGPRRTAKYTSIYPRRILRATKNGNGNTFVRGGHGGPRRTATATATSFCPRRAAKDREEHLFFHEGH